MNNYELPIMPEMLANLAVENLNADKAAAFTADTLGFLDHEFNLQVDLDISAVTNDADTVHLSLPYYSAVTRSIDVLSVKELMKISGGVPGMATMMPGMGFNVKDMMRHMGMMTQDDYEEQARAMAAATPAPEAKAPVRYNQK